MAEVNVQVVPTWDGFRLPRATRLYHRSTAQDFDAPLPPPEPDTYQPFLVRVPLKGLGRNPYLWNTAQDFDAPPPVEVDTLAQFLVRIPFKPLGHSSYLLHSAQDLSFVEPFDLPSFLAKPQYKRLGRNPYLWNTAQDFSFTPPVPEEETLAPHIVRLNIRGQWWIVPAYLLNLAPQDEDAPPIVVPTSGVYIPTFRPRRGR